MYQTTDSSGESYEEVMVAVSLEGVADRIRQRGVGEKVWCVDLL